MVDGISAAGSGERRLLFWFDLVQGADFADLGPLEGDPEGGEDCADATDNDRVAGVQFRVDGSNLGGEDTSNPYSTSWDTRTLANGTHTLTAVARDGSGNITTSTNVAVTVTNTSQPAGLIAAYSFDQGNGTSAPDASGNNNNGTLTNGPTWSPTGKYGGALSFDGINDMVTIQDANTLDLTTGMTLEAWVRPVVTGWPYRTILFKETTGGLVYDLYITDQTRPLSSVVVGGFERIVNAGTALLANTWTHLAATYDGTTLRLFLNGTQAATLAVGGSMTTTTGPLKIGGNAVWGEWFNGLIDEVRVYNRALSATEITTDMNKPVGAVAAASKVSAKTTAKKSAKQTLKKSPKPVH